MVRGLSTKAILGRKFQFSKGAVIVQGIFGYFVKNRQKTPPPTIRDGQKWFQYQYWLLFCTWIGCKVQNVETTTNTYLNAAMLFQSIEYFSALWLVHIEKICTNGNGMRFLSLFNRPYKASLGLWIRPCSLSTKNKTSSCF